MKISFVNQIGHYRDDQIYWMITGQQTVDGTTSWVRVDAAGKPVVMSTGDNKHPITLCNQTASYANYGFTLADVPAVTVDDSIAIAGGVIFVSIGSYLPIQVPASGAPQMPTAVNPCIPGYATIWQRFEFTLLGNGTISCNTTNVDMVGIPITAEIRNSDGSSDTVGFEAARQTLISGFVHCPNPHYGALVIPGAAADDPPLRILSPEHVTNGLGIPPPDVEYFNSFFDAYISTCWSQWASGTLAIDAGAGQVYYGQVQSGNLGFWDTPQLSGTPLATFSMPTTNQMLSDSLPVVSGQPGINPMDISRYVTAAMHRTVATNAPAGTWCGQTYYAGPPVEHYAKTLHAASLDGLCYAFSFDDVCDQSTLMNTPANATTTELVLILPSWAPGA